MDEVFKDPAQFSKGINLSDVMNGGAEFSIDMDFKKTTTSMLINGDDDLFPDGEDENEGESEDVLKIIEEGIDNLMLTSPEYHSFEELAKRMIDCEPSGNVKILILEEGNGPLVPVDAEVTIHYAAYWEKASIPFDSTLTMNGGNPMRIRLGQGRIIAGLEIALTTVRGPMARLQLLVQPAAAWGSRGVLPRVLPQPALFVITLYSVRDLHAAHRFNDLPSAEQSKFEVTKTTVDTIRLEAKDLFKKKRYTKAIQNYQQAISVINISKPQSKEEENELKDLKISTLLNLALCYSKINKPKYIIRTLESLDYITDIEKNCKALFYYGKANELLGKMDVAVEYYQKALKLEPKNKDIGKTLEDLDNYLKKSAKQEKKMWQTVFKVEKEKEVEVDEDFQHGVKDMFQELVGQNEYARFDLPPGLNSKEVDYVKFLANEFGGLRILEEGDGKKKKVTIVKQIV